MTAKSISSRKSARYAVISVVLCLLVLVGLAFLTETNAHAATVTASGTCGDGLTWELDDEGTLTISGSGAMTSWSSYSYVPWSSYCYVIKYVAIGNGVTSIGNSAFMLCSSLTSITIPDSVTSIGNYAFHGCTGLTEIKFNAVAMNDLSSNNYVFYNAGNNGDGIKVTIGKDVTKIPANLFYPYSYSSSYSPKITSVEFEEGSVCKSIGYSAFYWCSSLTSITIPNSVTSIGYQAFRSCSSLTSIAIPDSVTSIGRYAFEYCSKNLESITVAEGNSKYHSSGNCLIETESKTLILGCKNSVIPSDGSVTSIGSSAFEDCSSLTSITIPDSVTSIGWYAFSHCSSLTSITIPNSVTSIGYSAFSYCSSLTSITIPNSVMSIEDSAFYNCTGLTEIKFNAVAMNGLSENNCVFAFAGNNGDGIKVTIGKDVTKIPAYLFCPWNDSSWSPKITSVEFKEGSVCKSIGYYAFYYCRSLTSITIPNSVTSIGYNAFSYCSSLTSITIPDSVTSIGNYAFEYCSSLTSITIPDSVTSIGSSAFSGCSSLTSITIPDSVTSIWSSAFSGCSSLSRVNISDIAAWCAISFGGYSSNPLSYAKNLYLNGSLVTEVLIPDSVTSIGNYAFSGCSGLTSVTIPDSVTSIGNYAFSGCSGLTSITIPDSVTSIGNYAFSYCSSLTSVTIPDSVTSIGSYAFYYCSKLTSVTIPDSVTSIGWGAFYYCSSLKFVTINSASIASNVTSSSDCGYLAYYAKTIAIKSDITTIGSYITSNFTNVDTLTLNGVSYNVYSKHTHGEGDANWTVAENGDKVCSECGLTVSAQTTDPEKTEGYCGKNVKWAFDNETSILTITGKGAMKDYSGADMPWYAYASQIKEVVISEGVTAIGKNAFNNEDAGFVFTEVSLPSTLTSIGNYAFYGCTGLAEIEIPASVTSIGKYALRKTGITNVMLGRCGKTADWMLDDDGVLTIFGDGAMFDYGSKNAPWASYKAQIKSVVVCEGVTYVGNCAFYECANITSVSLASTVTSIGNYAFYSCRAIVGVAVPADVANIGIYAFRKCTALTMTFENADGWSYGDADAEISAEALKMNYKNAWTRA